MVFIASKKGAANDIALRDSMFPNAALRLWGHRQTGAFVTIPKTMPFIVRILDEVTNRAPVGNVYSVLWTYTWNNDAFVKMSRAKELAYACQYTGPRGVRTLLERLAKLRELGMIETAPGTDGDISFIFLPNPHYALIKLWVDKTVHIQERSFNAFRDRATNMGAKDVIQMLAHIAAGGTLTPIPPPPPMPAAPPAPTPIFPTTPPPAPPAAPPPPPAPAAPSITPAEAQAMIDSLPPILPKA